MAFDSFRRSMCGLKVWLHPLALLGCMGATNIAAASEVRFNMLNYNIHGLPQWLIDDDPIGRMPKIGRLSNEYDLVLLQEDFDYHHLLRNEARHALVVRGVQPGMSEAGERTLWDTLSTLGKVGSGLTILAKLKGQRLLKTERLSFDECIGYFDHGWDCFANKGVVMARIALADGIEIDVYNTHLESGGKQVDINLGRRQLLQVTKMIERVSAGRVVIISGDFNMDWNRKGYRKILNTFMKRAHMQRVDIPRPGRLIDHIFIRPGDKLGIEVLKVAAPDVFKNGDLSDHPGLSATLRVFDLDP